MGSPILLVLLAGCLGFDKFTPSDAFPAPGGDDSVPSDCTGAVVSLWPDDGSARVPPDAVVHAILSGPAPDLAVTVDPETAGTLTVDAEGVEAHWTPAEPWARSTTFTVSVSACGGSTSTHFGTVGDPIPTTSITGRTYDLAFGPGTDAEWIQPGSGPTLATQAETAHLLMMVQSADAADIDVVVAAGFDLKGGLAQYPCTVAVDVPRASFGLNPYFRAGPIYARLVVGGAELPVWDLVLEGAFASDGGAVEGMIATGLLDIAPLSVPLKSNACTWAEVFGDNCIACPTGLTTCLPLEVHVAAAPWVEGLVLDPYLTPDETCN